MSKQVKSEKMRLNIGLLGGAFDPFHLGHAAMVQYAFDHHDLDQVWVIPCWWHPYHKTMASFDDRVAMVQLGMAEFGEQCQVLDIEKEWDGESYTIHTVEALTERYPDYVFFLIVGDDAALDLVNWRESERLLAMVAVIQVPRGPESVIPDVSSTQVREWMQQGREISTIVGDDVAAYIQKHRLYRS